MISRHDEFVHGHRSSERDPRRCGVAEWQVVAATDGGSVSTDFVTDDSARPGSPTGRNRADMNGDTVLFERDWTPEKPRGGGMTEELTRLQQRKVPAALHENVLELPRPLGIVAADAGLRFGIASARSSHAMKRTLEIGAPKASLPHPGGLCLGDAKRLSGEAVRERTWFAHAQWWQAAASALPGYPQAAWSPLNRVASRRISTLFRRFVVDL